MRKIRFGVIPAAGPGKRMGYLSQILPKCLFPLYDKPIVHYAVENMKRVGIEKIYVIVNYQKEKVKEYFEYVKDEIDVSINFIDQERLSGIANAIMLTRNYINEPFMVILGDDCTIASSLDNLVDSYFINNAVVVEGMVRERNKEILRSTCCARLDRNKRIIEIVEKPENPIYNLRGCGIYILGSDIFKYIESTPVSPIRNEVEITQTIDLVARDKKAYGEFINGVNININSYEDLLQAWNLARKLNANT